MIAVRARRGHPQIGSKTSKEMEYAGEKRMVVAACRGGDHATTGRSLQNPVQ